MDSHYIDTGAHMQYRIELIHGQAKYYLHNNAWTIDPDIADTFNDRESAQKAILKVSLKATNENRSTIRALAKIRYIPNYEGEQNAYPD